MKWAIISIGLLATACTPEEVSVKNMQADKARQAAQSLRFTENAEIDNIKHRLELTANPGMLGFILLLNQAGQPILYEGVKGKVTSGTKRLTATTEVRCVPSYNSDGVRNGCNHHAVPSPSDEGTYGSSSEYIFYWNTDGVYRQWTGAYLYSDQPIRTRVEPLVIAVQTTAR